MRFIHTSDWHLGRIFYGTHLTDDQAYILEDFIRLVSYSKPDAVLIAGDIYDRAAPPAEVVSLLDDVLSRILLDCRVPVVLIAGNHDSPERVGFAARLLARQGLHIAGVLDKNIAPVEIHDADGTVYIYPLPYADPPVVREKFSVKDIHDHNEAMAYIIKQLTVNIPTGARLILVGHAFVVGGEVSESERPLSIEGSGFVDPEHFFDFHYAALGHLHRPQYAGRENIRYSGSLMKYSFSEAGHRKSVALVEMDRLGKTTIEEVYLTHRRDVRCLEGLLNDILAGPRSGESRDDYLKVTLTDSGAILDAIGKLRNVYPNVLHIERPFLAEGLELCGPGGDHRGLSETSLFSSFFEQVTGAALPAEQLQVFKDTVENLYRQERKATV
ncbi:MAG TPA: exonuclease sbcCD subunit D [Desulfotomaculum sp.]|nr:MAG: Nuclease SbcCD, D subunit [Desulfotomaculum sp. 46_80]HAG11414.1 exonuclease sbcCD subunit D [Desulfotomaculum sp.]HBY05160.1 exonuclease sbcCD subunit D [Desulfotomaculum sp.]